jgi:uncharacterized protein YoxC
VSDRERDPDPPRTDPGGGVMTAETEWMIDDAHRRIDTISRTVDVMLETSRVLLDRIKEVEEDVAVLDHRLDLLHGDVK